MITQYISQYLMGTRPIPYQKKTRGSEEFFFSNEIQAEFVEQGTN